MPIANVVKEALSSSSLIRRMFEEGIQLKKQHGFDKVFDFSLGNPDLDPPPAFHRVLLKLAEEDKKGSHGYMPNGGFPEVREVMARKASEEQNVSIDGSHVVMTVGAAGALNVVFKSILNPGDEVVIPKPYFLEYRQYLRNFQGVLIEVDSLPGFELDVETLKSKLTPKTAAVLICSPHNPTGKVYSAETISRLAAVLDEHGKKCGRMPYLVADEPYRDLVYDGVKVPPVLPVYSESIIVSSYSKSLSLPGERIGFIAVSPKINDKDLVIGAFIFANRVLGYVNAPALMQRVVAELTLAKVDVNIYASRRNALMKVCDDAGIEYYRPEGAFYLFCKTPGGGDDTVFVDHLKKYLVLGVPGSAFGAPGWMRFAYCVDEMIINASAPAFKKAMEDWKSK